MWITTKDLAKEIGVSTQIIYSWIKEGKIPKHMIKRTGIRNGKIHISRDAIKLLKNRNKPKPMNMNDLVQFAFSNMSGICEQSGIAVTEIYDIFIDKLNDKFGYK